MIGLRWSDIDFKNKILHVRRTMEYRHGFGEWRIGEPKTQRGVRDIPLTQEAIRMILGHSNIGITMNLYVHVTDVEKEKEMRNIEDMIKII